MPAPPRLSYAFLFASLGFTASLGSSGLGSLLATAVNLGLLLALQRAARNEGRVAARTLIRRDSVRS